jgi:hypothetical protein
MPAVVRKAAPQALVVTLPGGVPSKSKGSFLLLSLWDGGGGGGAGGGSSGRGGGGPGRSSLAVRRWMQRPPPRVGREHQRTRRQTIQCASALLLVAIVLAVLRRLGSNHIDPTAASLSLLLFRPSSDEHLAQQQQQQQQEPTPPPPVSSSPEPPRLWSYEEIDAVLGGNRSRHVVEASVRHLHERMDKARNLAKLNLTVYGTLRDPLFGFFIPKTGSNTQEYYQLEALAAIRQVSFSGCKNHLYGCLQEEPHLSSRTCRAPAFGNHFSPKALIPELVRANCTLAARGWSVDPASPTTIADVLSNYGVCTAVFRNPLERIVSAFYEWSYHKTTNLTAIEYWHAYGSSRFPKPQPQGSFLGMYNFRNDPAVVQPAPEEPVDGAVLEAVMTSCVVGITENLTDYVTTLSRILWINPPAKEQSALKVRSRERHGMTATATNRSSDNSSTMEAEDLAHWTRQFYEEMEAFVRHDLAVWNLARHVASAQVSAATRPPHHTPILPSHVVPKELRKGVEGNCPGCARCTPSEYRQYRWTSYAAKENAGDSDGPAAAARKAMAAGAGSGALARWVSWFGGMMFPATEEEPVVCIGPDIRQQQLPDSDGEGPASHLCCAHERFT